MQLICVFCCRYINELIELIATAKERKLREKAEESTHQRVPDPMPQKKPPPSGVETSSLGPLESRKVAPDINPLQKSSENDSKIIGGVGTATRTQPSHDTKSVKEVTCQLSGYTGASNELFLWELIC
jgi:hypothetical protein